MTSEVILRFLKNDLGGLFLQENPQPPRRDVQPFATRGRERVVRVPAELHPDRPAVIIAQVDLYDTARGVYVHDAAP